MYKFLFIYFFFFFFFFFGFFFYVQVTPMFLPSFKWTGLSVQEKKLKLDFKDDGRGGHFVFPIGTILAIFDVQVTLMLPTKFQVN